MRWQGNQATQSGLVRFFQFIYAQQIAADWPFEFRISGLTEAKSKRSRGRAALPRRRRITKKILNRR